MDEPFNSGSTEKFPLFYDALDIWFAKTTLSVLHRHTGLEQVTTTVTPRVLTCAFGQVLRGRWTSSIEVTARTVLRTP